MEQPQKAIGNQKPITQMIQVEKSDKSFSAAFPMEALRVPQNLLFR